MQYIRITNAAVIFVLGKITPKFAPILKLSTFVTTASPFYTYFGWFFGYVCRSVCFQNKIYLDETHGSKHLYETYPL